MVSLISSYSYSLEKIQGYMNLTKKSENAIDRVTRNGYHLLNNSHKYILIILLTSFDFYIDGVRIFDFFAYFLILLLVIMFLVRGGSIRFNQLVILIFMFYAFLGLVTGGAALTAAAIFFNGVLFFVFSRDEFLVEEKHVRFAILFHMFFFIVQFFLYHVYSQVVNFHHWTDIEPRLLSSIFRPAGLFYEPAIFCLNIFMLLMLLPMPKSKFLLFESLAILTLVLSMSLLGFIFATMAVIRFFRNKRTFLFLYLVMASLVGYLFVDDVYLNSILYRVLNLESDGSAHSRYSGLLSILSPPNFTKILFGMGFGHDYEEFGGSGIGASVSYVGIIGALYLTYNFLKNRVERFTRFLALMAIAMSAPIFSYAIFPFWIANFCNSHHFLIVHKKNSDSIE